MKKILTLCKPTYNRSKVLIHDIKDYLSLDDSRFCIKVNDNRSTDDTMQVLSEINDERLYVSQNPENLGPIRNSLAALRNSNSDYIMFLIDKDTIDVSLLSEFMDYLEREKPVFGYVDLNIYNPRGMEIYSPGVLNIQKMAYLSKHPSGYFWKTDVFEGEIGKSFYNEYHSFDFIFDLINGPIAAKYPGTIVHMPLIINENIRTDDIIKRYATNGSYGYSTSNIYFGKEKRLVEFQTYIKSASSLDLSIEDKQHLAVLLSERAISNVTTVLHDIMLNKTLCTHYHLNIRKLTFNEMVNNTRDVLEIFKHETSTILPQHFVKTYSRMRLIKTLIIVTRHLVRALYVKPKDGKSAF